MAGRDDERGVMGFEPSFVNFLRATKRRIVLRGLVPIDLLLGTRAKGDFGILMYHRVSECHPGASTPTWNVTPDRFRQQLSGLLARGFHAWSLRKVIDHSRSGTPIPPGVFVVTFDDGYENVYRNAWPILEDLGVPATVFLVTAFLDSRAALPFDDWVAAGSDLVPAHSWRPLTVAQCRELVASHLIELGAHTHTHADFRGRPKDFEKDLTRCVEFMREQFGLTEVTLAFPYGVVSQGFVTCELIAAAQRAGVLCSLSTEPELTSTARDPHTWGRFEVCQADTETTIAVRLDGWYDLIRSARRSTSMVPADQG